MLGNINKHIVLKRIICIKLVNKYRFGKLILPGSSLLITCFYVPKTYHYHTILSEPVITNVNIHSWNLLLSSPQSQNTGLTTSCLPYVTRCSDNKVLPEIALLSKFTPKLTNYQRNGGNNKKRRAACG